MRIITNGALLLALCCLPAAPAIAQDKAERARGELLYSTFCVSCHTTQAHWREKSIVTDLKSLRVQVRRWQTNAGQNWSDADIEEVVNHLDRLYYKYPATSGKG
jgi:mono/diheme cytochrome c family protein